MPGFFRILERCQFPANTPFLILSFRIANQEAVLLAELVANFLA
jgi:hypothetical protein